VPYKDPERRKAYHRKYNKRWYEEHKDERKAQIRQYKRANPDRVASWDSKPEALQRKAAARRAWRVAHRERDNRTRRIWTKANRDRVREYNRKREQQRAEYRKHYYLTNRDYFLQRSRIAYLRKRLGISDEQYATLAAHRKPTP
jgi:hypothetical protein